MQVNPFGSSSASHGKGGDQGLNSLGSPVSRPADILSTILPKLGALLSSATPPGQ